MKTKFNTEYGTIGEIVNYDYNSNMYLYKDLTSKDIHYVKSTYIEENKIK